MPDSRTISLVIPPEPPSKSRSLEAQIQQIISQKGPFRHVTESSLLAEIHGKTSVPDTTEVDQGNLQPDEEDESPQKQTERLWERRNQMLERLGQV
jgi:hypothetical protein